MEIKTKQLLVDFEVNLRYELVISRETSFTRSEMQQLELKMLQSKQLPATILPVEWVELNHMGKFHYALRGRGQKLVNHVLATQTLSMKQWLSLIVATADVLCACSNYMLRPDCFVLDERTVFVNDRLDHVSLCYLPLQLPHSTVPAQQSLLLLALQWLKSVEHVDLATLQLVVAQLQQPKIDWVDVKSSIEQRWMSNENDIENDINEKQITEHSSQAFEIVQPTLSSERNKRQYILFALTIVVGIGWITIYYPHQDYHHFVFSLAVTLLASLAGWFAYTKIIPTSHKREESVNFELNDSQATVANHDDIAINYDDATQILLGDQPFETKKSALLTIEREYRNERTPLVVDATYMIGRDEKSNHYVERAPGVSRVHLECNKKGEELLVKDVASSNGSTLNGVTMIPYKSYLLRLGDCIQLAGEHGPKYHCVAR